jgi:hypothetical protein
MMHAVPGKDIMQILAKSKKYNSDSLSIIEWPGFPKDGDSLQDIFIKVVGAKLRKVTISI